MPSTIALTLDVDKNRKQSSSNPLLPAVTRPQTLAHVMLRTSPENFHAMKAFYKTFLNADPAFENPYISFLRYDHEYHRIGIIAIPGTTPRDPNAAGLAHVAFTFASLRDLARAYQQRKEHSIFPSWCVNHGACTSIYYRDPDGNEIETEVDNFDDDDAADGFLASKAFAVNPIGTDFDPEQLIRRLEAGEDERSIKKRIEIGPRLMP